MLLAVVMLVGGMLSAAPGGQQPYAYPGAEPAPNPFADRQPVDPVMAARQMRALNLQRQKTMVADADKLLQLARQLNEEVAAGKSETLTPAQLHKVAEIGKLARKVKQEMVFSVGSSPKVPDLFSKPIYY